MSNNLPEIVRTESNRGLSGLQIQAIELLLVESNISEIARKLNVSRQTIHNWLNDARFNVHLSQREAALLRAATTKMITLAERATELLSQAADGHVLDSNQRFMIEVVTKRWPRFVEVAVIYGRLAELERQLGVIQD